MYTHKGILHTYRKEWSTKTWMNFEKIKWKKAEREDHVLYESITETLRHAVNLWLARDGERWNWEMWGLFGGIGYFL